jgi:hypothetical protein
MHRKIAFFLQIFAMLAGSALMASAQDLQRTAQAGGVTGVATPLNLADAKAGTIDIKGPFSSQRLQWMSTLHFGGRQPPASPL